MQPDSVKLSADYDHPKLIQENTHPRKYLLLTFTGDVCLVSGAAATQSEGKGVTGQCVSCKVMSR